MQTRRWWSTAMSKALWSALLALCLFGTASAQNLFLTLANQPPTSGIVTTRDNSSLTLTAMSGSRVSFARASGRDYQLQASGGFFWTQVQEQPRDADSVALTPTVREDGSIEVIVDVSQKAGQRRQSYSSTLLAQPGEWLQLLGPAAQQPRGTKVYGTQSVAAESLFLLVETP
ncbi:hypothetical protein [Congregibacter litoralis]|uniref:Uncharacterized protein n=1 Tax=Congregibacter litoralis KT71 TaxID=314285 RepID=A4ABE3_9GAMM|nr:hypothetical protein [Congregibacter litoralis]EAQ96697.2 hypothetical protein KT71_06729 [Congregibacter litoralis KT71]